jgi:hypothetical protein
MAFWNLSVTIGNLWVLVANAGVNVFLRHLRVRCCLDFWTGGPEIPAGGLLSKARELKDY